MAGRQPLRWNTFILQVQKRFGYRDRVMEKGEFLLFRCFEGMEVERLDRDGEFMNDSFPIQPQQAEEWYKKGKVKRVGISSTGVVEIDEEDP